MTRLVLAALLALTALTAQAAPDKAAVLARIEEVSDYHMLYLACGQAAYQIHEEAVTGADRGLFAEARASGESDKVLFDWVKAAEARSVARFEALLQALDDARAGDPAAPGFGARVKAATTAFTDYVWSRCDRASRDRLYAKVVVSPGPEALAAYRSQYLDDALQSYGQASFQPPEAMAQAALLAMAAACRDLIPAQDLERYKGGILEGPEPSDPAKLKLRRWYAIQYEMGFQHAGEVDAGACRQRLTRLKAELPPS